MMQGRMSNGSELVCDVVPALDETADAPLFDAFGKQQIRSLRDAMLDFAQSVDRSADRRSRFGHRHLWRCVPRLKCN